MTASKSAQAGSFTFGELDLESVWPRASADASRLLGRQSRPGANTPQGSGPGAGEARFSFAGAEEELYRYLERVKAASAKPRISPVEALTGRLQELSQVLSPPAAEPAPQAASAPAGGATFAQSQLAWFDEKFAELRSLVTSRKDETPELVSINARLAEIVERVDNLAKLLPGEPGLKTIESQLSKVSGTLDDMQVSSASHAESMAKAASAVSIMAMRLDRSRAALDEAANQAFDRVAAAAEDAQSRTAQITAEQITEALRRAIPQSPINRVEEELRALNMEAREAGQRTAQTLERVHDTLRDFLTRVDRQPEPNGWLPPHLKRQSVNKPITAGERSFSRAPNDFGAASQAGSASQLRKITDREAQLRDTLMQRLERQRGAAVERGEPEAGMEAERPQAPIPAFLLEGKKPKPRRTGTIAMAPEVERRLPLLKLSIVGLILLLASAAMLYLQITRGTVRTAADTPRTALQLTPGPGASEAASPSGEDRSAASQPSAPGAPFAGSARDDSRYDHRAPQHFLQASSHSGGWQAQINGHDRGRLGVTLTGLGPVENADNVQKLAVAASNGDSEAQYQVARRFLADPAIRSSGASAARWLARAADQGHVQALFLLATLHEGGIGVPKDDGQAARLYERAAEAGHTQAMHNLAVLLTGRNGLNADYARAFEWFTRAARRGVADSQFNLAILHEHGLGVRRDERLAYFWYSIAGLRGDHEAQVQAQRLRATLPADTVRKTDIDIKSWAPEHPPHPSATGNTPG
jgi:TPR repeat protein